MVNPNLTFIQKPGYISLNCRNVAILVVCSWSVMYNVFTIGWFTECSRSRLHANRAYLTPSVSRYVFEPLNTFVIFPSHMGTSLKEELILGSYTGSISFGR